MENINFETYFKTQVLPYMRSVPFPKRKGTKAWHESHHHYCGMLHEVNEDEMNRTAWYRIIEPDLYAKEIGLL